MNLRSWIKVVLFLNAYTPLWLIFAVRIHVLWSIAVFSSVAVLSFLLLAMLIERSKKAAPTALSPADYQNKGGDSISYIIAYIIPFIGYNLHSAADVVSVCILLVVVGAIYIHSDLMCTNPILFLLRFNVFLVTSDTGKKIYLLTRKSSVRKDELLRVVSIDQNIYLEVPRA